MLSGEKQAVEWLARENSAGERLAGTSFRSFRKSGSRKAGSNSL